MAPKCTLAASEKVLDRNSNSANHTQNSSVLFFRNFAKLPNRCHTLAKNLVVRIMS